MPLPHVFFPKKISAPNRCITKKHPLTDNPNLLCVNELAGIEYCQIID